MDDARLERFEKTEELIAWGARLVEEGTLSAEMYRESVETMCAIADACDNGTDRELVETAQRALAVMDRHRLRLQQGH
jgi:hypothetical protein